MTIWKKDDIGKGYQNPKRKLGGKRHFLEIIKLQFGKKMPYIQDCPQLFK